MSKSPEPESRVQHAELLWDDEGQPLSSTFGDVYFSRVNGLAETRHVFLQHNQLSERFAALSAGDVFVIGETGFGSGLNFLAAWQLWQQIAHPQAHLHFVTVEKYPLDQGNLVRALALWPELDEFSQALIAQYPEFTGNGFHRLKFAADRVNLTLIINDAAQGFGQLLSSHPLYKRYGAKMDAWFLDGFAPAKNPQMWSDELFDVIGALSHKGTTAATFSAAGIVKQGLRRAGFSVKKVAGFGRKREMVAADYTSEPAPLKPDDFLYHQRNSPYPTPWMVPEITPQRRKDVTIIGAGLAGCHTARALAERGWQVTLIERQPRIADEASGNPQGVLYAKLSHTLEPQAAFNLASLQFAVNHYSRYWQQRNADGALIAQNCGVLQLAHDASEAQLHTALRERFTEATRLVRFVDAAEASALAGISLTRAGMYFPTAGWISPPLLCEQLVNHPNIRVVLHSTAVSLQQSDIRWTVLDAHQQSIAQAAHVVIANARDAGAFEQCENLPIRSIRGQISFLPATAASRALTTVLCADGYVGPACRYQQQDLHFAGATFNLRDESRELRAQDHQTNLEKLATNAPALNAALGELTADQLAGRVAFRCTTLDYLPLLGPVPDRAAFLSTFAPLRKNAKAGVPAAGRYLPGLFLNIGHGSRGLAYTPLCAELLAAQMNNEPWPISHALGAALNPARFMIRDLMRNKI